MKIPSGYLLRTVAGKNIVVSVADSLDFNGMLTLNDTGVFLWNKLCGGTTKEELVFSLLDEYDVSRSVAQEDTEEFLSTLRKNHLLEE